MRGDSGSAAVELTILTPLFVLFLLLVVTAGRVVQARNDVYGAAGDAARAASARQTPVGAETAARSAAEATLRERGMSCRDFGIALDASALRPGGSVRVAVTCRVALSDMTLLAVPGTRTVRAEATEVVDVHRSDP
jgi:Flp pilus assembly protein TadG